ncbi:hypothetical protein GCM10027217_10390 [Pseudomaricurvus hydrocarbonicus]
MQRQGTQVFERTQVKAIAARARSLQLTIATGLSTKAKHAVIASGYETQGWLRQRVILSTGRKIFTPAQTTKPSRPAGFCCLGSKCCP